MSLPAFAYEGTATDDSTAVASITKGETTYYYASLKDAVADAQDDDTVKLLKSVDVDKRQAIGKSMTIDGSGLEDATVKINAGKDNRVFDISDQENVTFTLKKVYADGSESKIDSSYARGVSLYGNKNVKLVLDNASVSSPYYAINIAGANEGVDVEMKNASASAGWSAFNVWSPATITVSESELSGNNDKSYSNTGWNNFGTIVMNKGSAGSKLLIEDSTVIARMNGNLQLLLDIRDDDIEATFKNVDFKSYGTVAEGATYAYNMIGLYDDDSARGYAATNTKLIFDGCKFYKDDEEVETVEELFSYLQCYNIETYKSTFVFDGVQYFFDNSYEYYRADYATLATNENREFIGGLFYDDPSANVADGYKAVYNGDGTWTVAAKEYVAQVVNGDKYETLMDAIDAVPDNGTATIMLLADVTAGSGLATSSANADGHPKNLTIDLGGFTYTVEDPAVGSTNTKSQAMHWAADSNITLKNGTIEASKNATGVKMMLQNYANLTLENITLDATYVYGGTYGTYTGKYAPWSNKAVPIIGFNLGTVTIKEGTKLVAASTALTNVNLEDGEYYSNVTIEGGEFEGAFIVEGATNYDNPRGSLTIKGGKFANDPEQIESIDNGVKNSYLADGYKATESDGTWTVIPANSVALIAGKGGYATLAAAVAAVDDDETITLVEDSSGAKIDNGKRFTIDLNEKKLTSGFSLYRGFVTLDNGVVNGGVWVYSGESNTTPYNSLTIADDAEISASYAVVFSNQSSSTKAYGSTINVNGKLYGNLWVMGNITEGNSEINVTGTVDATGKSDVGIALNGYATLNVSEGANVKSNSTGIEVRAGNLNVSGGTIIGTGRPSSITPNGSGTTSEAAGIAVSTYDNSEISVNISGGAISGYSPLYLANTTGTDKDFAMSVTGGTFTVTNALDNENPAAVAMYEDARETRAVKFISGGMFSTKPDASYIAEGLVTKQVDGMYTVGEPVAKIGSVNYATIGDALAAVNNNETIELTKNGAFNVIIDNGKTFNLDLGKHTLTGYIDLYRGSVTLQNGTVMGTAHVNGYDQGAGSNVLTIADTATIEASESYPYAVILWQSSGKAAYGSTINMNGTLKGNLWVMGNITAGDSDINVNGTIDATGKSDVGIALNGHAILNVGENANVKSDSTGIEVRAGQLNVSGGTIAGTGDYTVEPNGSGTTTSGAGIAVAQHTTKLNTGVSITGGTISGTMGLSIANPQNNTDGDMNVSVTGGAISAVNVHDYNGKSVINSDFRVSGFIKGGTFSDDPNAAYVADGYKSVAIAGGRYEVGKATVTQTVEENPTDANTRTYKVSTDVSKTNATTGEATSTNLETKSNQEITVTGTTTEAEVAAVTTQDSKVSQAAGAIALNEIDSEEIDTVVMAALASAGAQATSVSSVKIAIVKDSGTEKMDDSSNKVTKVTYDVHPEAIAYVDNNAVGSTKITNEQLANNVTYSFKLPVPDVLATTGTVKVTHISEGYQDDVKTLRVEGNTANYYVTVTATHFSDFVIEAEDLGTLASSNLALGGMTIMNYYFAPNTQADFTNVKAQFVIESTGRIVTVAHADWSVWAEDPSYMIIKCPLYAQEITSDVTFSLLNGEQTAKFAIVGSAHRESYSDSIEDYWTRYEKNYSISDPMATLRDKMLAYGEYTCYALNKSGTITHKLSNPSISAIDEANSITQTGDQGKLASISMVLGSGTSMKLYIVRGGNEYTFEDGAGNPLSATTSGNYYVVKSNDVAANKYDDQQTIVVKSGDVTVNTIGISINKCIDLTLKNARYIEDATLDVCRAIYEYGLATNEAISSN